MIRVRQIKIEVDKDNIEEITKQTAKKLRIPSSKIKNLTIKKKSLDARQKPKLYFSYEVDIETDKEELLLNKNKSKDIFKTPIEKYSLPNLGNTPLTKRPIIVGSGPAGLFCAYLLAELGFHPIIIERRKSRKKSRDSRTFLEDWRTK